MRDNPNATKTNFHEEIYAIAQSLSSEPEMIRAAVSFLKGKGFVEYIYSGQNTLLGFKLTHVGLHSDEFEHLEAMEKWKERIVGVIGTLVIEVLIMGITPVSKFSGKASSKKFKNSISYVEICKILGH